MFELGFLYVNFEYGYLFIDLVRSGIVGNLEDFVVFYFNFRIFGKIVVIFWIESFRFKCKYFDVRMMIILGV